MALPRWLNDDPRLQHLRHRDAQPGITAPFPDWVSDSVKQAIADQGIGQLWRHQALAAQAAFDGRSVALSTGTASGKSLAYLLPILAATRDRKVGFPVYHGPLGVDRGHSALYIAPTKALAHDQFRTAEGLAIDGWTPATLDGDSTGPERRYAREFAHYVLTNPDMLHRSILPSHQRWVRLLSTLRYVVVDEAHRYRGVFGAHTAQVLRRLRRLAHNYGADPIFITASATISEAGELLTRLTGIPDPLQIDRDDSAHPELDFALWAPVGDPHQETADMLARLVSEGRQSLAFTTSRVQSELVALRAQQSVGESIQIRSYRAGYLPAERRALEDGLRSGRLRGAACTNALELGIDISGLDAVLSCGFPGTMAALWQQVGRAGRGNSAALAVLIARPDPLDAYLLDHPQLIFDSPVERTVLHPQNPQVLAVHVAAAAQELPITDADQAWFGPELRQVLERLGTAGYLRQRPNGWYWTRPDRAVDSIDLRSSGGTSVDVIDDTTGRVVGQSDPASADRSLHQGATYLHQGEPWLVKEYRPDEHVALVGRSDGAYFTQALTDSDIRILDQQKAGRLGLAETGWGTVELARQVTGFLRRDQTTGKVWDSTPLDLPRRTMRTQAVWYSLDDSALSGFTAGELPGAAHGAEHAAIGLLPAFAPCDRWDIGGLSTVRHADTGKLTVFVHDGAAGGAGFAAEGYARLSEWLAATWERLKTCPCEDGCPACVVSPKCGNGNHPLDKQAATRLLALLVG